MTLQFEKNGGMCRQPNPYKYESDSLRCTTFRERRGNIFIKASYRMFNIVFAVAVLTLSLPLMIVIAVMIKVDSPGPVLFRQTRIGINRRSYRDRRTHSSSGQYPERRRNDRRSEDYLGAPFKFYKFRTMKVNARELYPELYAYSYSSEEIKQLYFKIQDDPRLTRVGRWLRKSSLDELPNFLNVLKGDIVLVGPRPEIPEMSKYYYGTYKSKFSVKPGVTGLAQVEGRGSLKFYETARCDIEYVQKRSIPYDIVILLKTICSIIVGRGAF